MEVWKPVVGHEKHYEVSDQGRVRALPKPGKRGCIVIHGKYKILAQAVGGRVKSYKRVHLYNPPRFAYVHHLMAESFIGPRPEGLMVLHRDDNGFNNTIDNLRYGDREENDCDRHVRRVAPGLEEAPF
jgi:hypothetical protein